MVNSWYQSRNIYYGIIKSSLSVVLCLLVSTGCRQNATIFNTGPLTPLINSRYSSRNSVKTLIKLNKEKRIDYQQYMEGRHRYNRAASKINGLITQIIISIQANSQITDNKLFKDQIIAAFADSAKFQTYVETVSIPSNRRPSNTRGVIEDVLKTINLNDLIPKIMKEISTATKAARKANSQQRAIIVCELKSLLLPDFDDLEANSLKKDFDDLEANNLKKYPDSECAKLIEKKDFTPEPDNKNPS